MASGHVNRTKQAEQMAARTNAANVKKALATRSRPHMALFGRGPTPLPMSAFGSSADVLVAPTHFLV
jgi:hypothetical protein